MSNILAWLHPYYNIALRIHQYIDNSRAGVILLGMEKLNKPTNLINDGCALVARTPFSAIADANSRDPRTQAKAASIPVDFYAVQ